MEKVEKNLPMPQAVKTLQTILQYTTFCSLCFDSKEGKEEELLHLDYLVVLEDLGQEKITLRDLLEAVFGNTQDLVTSDYICKPCKSLAQNSYTFIYKTKRDVQIYTKYLEQLLKETSELSVKFNSDWKRAVIVLDNYEKAVNSKTEETDKYICDKCGKDFTQKSFLIKHLKKHKTDLAERKKSFSCPHCNIWPCIHKEYILAFKEQQELKIKPMSCLCGYTFGRTLSCLITHVNKDHLDIKPNTCKCGKSFYLRKQYWKHLEHCNNEHTCASCFNKFPNLKQLKEHIETCVTEKPYKVSKCPVRSKTKVDQSHIVKHTRKLSKVKRNRMYQCLICDKVLKTKLQLRSHVNNKHEKKPNLCLYCNKQYNSRQEYLEHVQSDEHKNNIQYGFKHHCTHCDYSANTLHMLKAHVNRIHLNIRPFECEHCQKRYFDITQLRNHVKSHTGQRKLKVCDICGANLSGPTALKKHRRLHTGENPYSCPYCEEKSNCASTLKTHIMRKHMEPTIQCPLCELKFHTMSNARGHVKKAHWKSKEKFDYTKLKGLSEKDYDFFRDRRKAVV
ncbi:zinc finger protein Xfin-like [Leguminivora glycinivorella]|uniref:zinc finger protein Xfin-like n=1 Tax=Leguminivora glycinivorella TaxID=1035111 RepID=UPI00200C3F22|nr:zinc finger protein Xfin-like [Leguminivora glycinivorella]